MAKMILTIVAIYLFYKYILPIILMPLKIILKGMLVAAICIAVLLSALYMMLT